MFTSFIRIIVSVAAVFLSSHLYAKDVVHHKLNVKLNPDKHFIQVEDQLTLANSGGDHHVGFLLHKGLVPNVISIGVVLNKAQGVSEEESSDIADYYELEVPQGVKTVTLSYQGDIYHPVEQQGEEYARSFSESPGIIEPDGVFLSSSSFWYPQLEEKLISFSLQVELPKTWDVVSQGKRILHEIIKGKRVTGWEESHPQDDIYIVAAKFKEYTQAAGNVQSMIFLRRPDESLAKTYLNATAQYLNMYDKLIGAYPYSKFALVENFWETGYGMPSFTLLGSKIIHYPFILYTSYPHEILHNWWGNGVYVDYDSGNWSEGLTSYLADHMLQEQRGMGVQYRRNTLQKYADYVDKGRDFPLTQFRSRHSSATEAVGYGKALMLFHMLRLQMGDEIFIKALRQFYSEYLFKVASFSDIKTVFSEVAGENLDAVFTQWVTRTGAPALQLEKAKTEKVADGYKLTFVLAQKQAGGAYNLQLPVAVYMEGQAQAYQTKINMNGKLEMLSLKVPFRPWRLDVDPEFDVFRRLDTNEIPPAFTQAFGAESVLILLPSTAPENVKKGYETLAESWKSSQAGQVDIQWDNSLNSLPAERTVWLFGWENRFLNKMKNALADYPVELSKDKVVIEKTELIRNKNSVAIAARHPNNVKYALSWLASDNVAAIPGLGRKLPHYGRDSYVAFTGDEPTKIIDGQWPVIHSPMSIDVEQMDKHPIKIIPVKLAPRKPLASPPPMFSSKASHMH